MACDEICLKGLKIFAHHGVFPEEREKGQDFFVNAVLYVDIRVAGVNDDLTATVDYGAVAVAINNYLTEHTFSLLETAAERCAAMLLAEFPLLRGVELEIEKPNAPIDVAFENVSVKITRQWHKIALSLGSNMGDKEKFLNDAVSAIKEHKSFRNVKCSRWVETAPYGGVDQDNFLNGALVAETSLSPWALLDFLHDLENRAGRKRLVRWGPRTLDLDIIFYDDAIIDTPDLTIPHIDMANRAFVLEPLVEIAAYIRHPLLNKTVSQLLQDLA